MIIYLKFGFLIIGAYFDEWHHYVLKWMFTTCTQLFRMKMVMHCNNLLLYTEGLVQDWCRIGSIWLQTTANYCLTDCEC